MKPGASFIAKEQVVYERRVRLSSLVGTAWQVGPVMPDLDWPGNHALAFNRRMGRQVPVVDVRAMKFFCAFARRRLVVCSVTHDLTGREWIAENKSYCKRRKRELVMTLETGESTSWARGEVQRVNAFGKNEPLASLGKAMRFIYAREDRFKTAVGPYIKPIEQLVYAGTHFVKGWTKLEVQDQMIRRIEPFTHKWVGDHHTFEATVGPEVMHGVIAWFYMQFGMPASMAAVLCGVNHIHSKQGRMRVRAGTMSGELDTSLRNGLINHLLMAFVVAQARRFNPELQADWMVEGDDVIIGASGDLPLQEVIRPLGFDFDCQRLDSCGDSGFCGWYYGPTGAALKPPDKVLKLGWEFGYEKSAKRKLQLYAGKLMGASMEYASSPLVWALLRDFSYVGKAVHRDGWKDLPGFSRGRGGWLEAQYDPVLAAEPTMDDREAYARLFGMHVVDQLTIEEQGVLTSPAFAEWRASRQPLEHAYMYTHQY